MQAGELGGDGGLVQVCTLTPWPALLCSAHSSSRGGAERMEAGEAGGRV